MATSISTDTVVGVFDDPTQAQRAVNDLRAAGYTNKQIGVVSHNSDGSTNATDGDAASDAGEGATVGAVTGLGVGALWGLGILAGILPGIGPAIAGGTLGVLMSSAAAGAAVAGLGGALMGLGLSDDDAAYYESEFKAGRTIVTVHGNPNDTQAEKILSQHGAYNRLLNGSRN